MPIYRKHDSKGYYFQYGNNGSKYYYNVHSKDSVQKAYEKAVKQTKAVHASKNKRGGALLNENDLIYAINKCISL